MLLKNCRLVPELTEGYQEHMADILVENGKIAAVAPCGTLPVGGEVLDLAGRTVLPGLFDLHAHLMLVNADFYGLLISCRSRRCCCPHRPEPADFASHKTDC